MGRLYLYIHPHISKVTSDFYEVLHQKWPGNFSSYWFNITSTLHKTQTQLVIKQFLSKETWYVTRNIDFVNILNVFGIVYTRITELKACTKCHKLCSNVFASSMNDIKADVYAEL
jgi:hypothetical protein